MPTVTTRKVTTTVEDGGAEPLDRYRGPIFDVIASLTPEDWQEHKAKIYRADESWDQKGQVVLIDNVFTGPFDENEIRKRWGGGRFLVWLYGPPNRSKVVRGAERVTLDGIPKTAGNGNGAGSADVQVLTQTVNLLLEEIRSARGGALTQEAFKGALQLQAEGLKSGVQTVRELNPNGQERPKSRVDELMEKLVEAQLAKAIGGQQDEIEVALRKAMIDRLINPTNPLAQAKEIIAAVKDLVPGGSGKTDMTSLANTLLSNLPSLADRAVAGVKEYRLAREAELNIVRTQATERIIDMPSASHETAGAAPSTSAAAPAAAPASATPAVSNSVEEVRGPTIEWVQLMIVDKIEKDPDAAGEWLYDWLEAIDPNLNRQIGGFTPEALLELFRSQPILKRVAEHPKLPKIIEQYLADAKEAATTKPS